MEKRIKTPFEAGYPKFLCCQKTNLGPLGVKLQVVGWISIQLRS